MTGSFLKINKWGTLPEDQYWEDAAFLYQQGLMTSELVSTMIETGPGFEADPEQTREFILQWQADLVKRTPIRWQDKALEKLYPEAVATAKQVVRVVEGSEQKDPMVPSK